MADEHGFVTFWDLVPGDYTLTGTSRTGIAIPQTKLTYPTAKTIEGARLPPAQSSGGATASNGAGAAPAAGAPS